MGARRVFRRKDTLVMDQMENATVDIWASHLVCCVRNPKLNCKKDDVNDC